MARTIAIGLIWKDGRLVVGKRGPDCPLAGYDEFPGGKCDDGETPEAAVVREIREETGLDVRIRGLRLRTSHDYQHGSLELHFFDCECADDNPNEPALLPPFRWVDLAEVLTLQFPEANAELLKLLANEAGE